jgi:mono/diheme cytochrome c family protein
MEKVLGILGVTLVAAMVTFAASSACAADLAKAKKNYASFCLACHGESGAGNGPGATALKPPPTNFTNCAAMNKRSDEFLYEVIAKGGSAEQLSPTMPGWSAAFTDSQIHGLVAYLRSFCK